MNPIPFALPDIGEEEINEVVDCLKSGWVTTGPRAKQFENDFSKYIGCENAFAVNSATSGLHLALDAIGIKKGDKVIVPVNTFTATAEVVRYFDADPIFCDIEPKTFNISISALKEILNSHSEKENIKAVMPVHIAGQACDMDKIIQLAREFNLKVIEDAAHALPTTYRNSIIGTLGDITVFSFYATKTICTAEGGMVVTNNKEFAKRINIMRLHGFDRDAWNRYNCDKPSWSYSIVAPGFKYNLTDIAASMGIHQLAKADSFFERRNKIAKEYTQAFKGIKEFTTPFVQRKDDKHAYHLYILKVEKRDEFIQRLADKGIGSSVHFIPLHLHPYWKEKYLLEDHDFPMAFKNFSHIMSLPIYTKLTNEEVQRIIEGVREVAKELYT